MIKKEISKENFQNFIDILSMLKGNCIDLDVCGGKIRQFSDNMMFIFEADIKNIVDEIDIVLPMIDNKLPLLSMFLDNYNDSNITLTIDENKYMFSDGITDLCFTTMNSKNYLDNKYITNEDLSKYIKYEGNIIFSTTLSRSVLNKINICSNQFNVQDVQIDIQNGCADINLFSFNMTNNAKIIGNIPVNNIDNNKKYREIFSVKPFKIDFKNEADFKLFFNGDSDEKVINHISFNNNDVFINIYAPGFLKEV